MVVDKALSFLDILGQISVIIFSRSGIYNFNSSFHKGKCPSEQCLNLKNGIWLRVSRSHIVRTKGPFMTFRINTSVSYVGLIKNEFF